MVGVFPHYQIRKHPAALPGGYLPASSMLCWEGQPLPKQCLEIIMEKADNLEKPRKEEVTKFKQSLLHKCSFKTHSSDLNSGEVLLPEIIGLVSGQYIRVATSLAVLFPSAHRALYTCAIHGLDLEVFPIQRVRVLKVEGQCCVCICC